MAQIRNNFIKSKMNRDLDSRLVPPGEYREALNVSVSKSEGADVGSLENISGNFLLTNFGFTEIDKQNIDVIGYLMDLNNDRIFVFMTNYVDTSADRLSKARRKFDLKRFTRGREPRSLSKRGESVGQWRDSSL